MSLAFTLKFLMAKKSSFISHFYAIKHLLLLRRRLPTSKSIRRCLALGDNNVSDLAPKDRRTFLPRLELGPTRARTGALRPSLLNRHLSQNPTSNLCCRQKRKNNSRGVGFAIALVGLIRRPLFFLLSMALAAGRSVTQSSLLSGQSRENV